MMRFPRWRLAFSCAATMLVAAAIGSVAAACGSTTVDAELPPAPDGGKIGRDGGPVDPLEGGGDSDAGTPLAPPSCTRYCELVQTHCKGEHAQYASDEQCLAFCAHLPGGDPYEQQQKAASLSCRHYYAGSPALTDPAAYCAAAGPFGGGLCGDRCTAFCQVTLSACSPDAGAAPYATQPDCKTACADFVLVDGGADGGGGTGEALDGPNSGNTLNCRLFHLRRAVLDTEACENLGPDAGACR